MSPLTVSRVQQVNFGTGTSTANKSTTDTSALTIAESSSVNTGVSIPSGYTLLKNFDLTTDEGWTFANKHTNNAAYYTSSNVTFTPSGMRIRLTEESSHTYNFTSGECYWGESAGFVGDEFYVRFVAKQEQPLILGDFPSFLWMRAITGDGNGEIDLHETMSNHIAGVTGATDATALGNKITMIKTPYDTNQVSYSKGITESAVGSTELNFCTTYHTFEIYKTLVDMTSYIDGVLMTQHVRGGTGGLPTGQNTTAMTNALWDSQFAAGKMWDLRVSYQYGDDPDGAPVGSAGTPSDFSGDRYLNLNQLLVAVPS